MPKISHLNYSLVNLLRWRAKRYFESMKHTLCNFPRNNFYKGYADTVALFYFKKSYTL